MTLNVDDLKVFALVVQEGSLSKAADTLNLGQPSVRTRLCSLEHVVGRTLVVRQDGAVRCTPEGDRLLPYARRCLTLLGEALEVTRDELPGAVRVGVHQACTEVAGPVLEHVLLEQALSTSVHQGDVEELVAALRAGHLDVAIATVGDPPEGIEVVPLRGHPSVGVAHRAGDGRRPPVRAVLDAADPRLP